MSRLTDLARAYRDPRTTMAARLATGRGGWLGARVPVALAFAGATAGAARLPWIAGLGYAGASLLAVAPCRRLADAEGFAATVSLAASGPAG